MAGFRQPGVEGLTAVSTPGDDGTLARTIGSIPGPVGLVPTIAAGFLEIPRSMAAGEIADIQAKVDELTRKAKQKQAFDDDEKEFLEDLYEWIAFGGRWKWLFSGNLGDRDKALWEAGELLGHYINGKGSKLKIDAHIYQTSVIVAYATEEMKKAIAADVTTTGAVRNGGKISSREVIKARNFGDPANKGQVVKDGVLLAEQNNARLKYANNRFDLLSTTMFGGKRQQGTGQAQALRTVWRVDDIWDYASFEEQKRKNRNDVTELPLKGGAVLRLPDGLSHYLTVLGIAKEFDYWSEWTENWSVTLPK